MSADTGNVKKALVTLAIEKTLLNMGEPAYEKVICILNEKHRCLLSDCFEKPQYLKAVLKEVHRESYNEIVNSIREKLKILPIIKWLKSFCKFWKND